jgi:nitroreductase
MSEPPHMLEITPRRQRPLQFMNNSKPATKSEGSLNAMDVIYHRRSVRDYAAGKTDPAIIRSLLDAAVHAPTAMHEEPWSFAVIQDKVVLNRLSESAKKNLQAEAQGSTSDHAKHTLELVDKPDFHVFYNAATLIVIYGKVTGPFVVADCWLAAENLLLAAYAQGLGSCVIGFAVATLNTPEWKAEFKIPNGMTAIAPVILGVAAGVNPPVPRKPAEILTWI